MSRWTPNDLAEAMAANPALRLHREKTLLAGDLSPSTAASHKDRHEAGKRPEPQISLKEPIKKRKYRNEPIEINGIRFDSKKEAARYGELKLLERAGTIESLTVHPKYEFVHNGVRIGSFRPDFSYKEYGQVVIEDVKSPPTRAETSYRIRKRLLKAFYDLDVREV